MLSDRQLNAIHQLVAGIKHTEIEKSVGVSHTQLWRWRREREFQAALENERSMLHERRADQLWALSAKAMDVATEALVEGDPKMAIDVLKLTAGGLTDIQRLQAPRSTDLSGMSLSSGRARTSGEVGSVPSGTASGGLACAVCGTKAGNAGAMARHREVHGI